MLREIKIEYEIFLQLNKKKRGIKKFRNSFFLSFNFSFSFFNFPFRFFNSKQIKKNYAQQQQQSRAKTPTSTTPTGGNTWQLCYVTERILAAILPEKADQSNKIDDLFLYDENGNRRGDKYELDLIQMLEQKHGKNYRLFDLESCLSTISLEKLCELCKHIETWLSGGQNKIVVLQDRLVSLFFLILI